LTRININHNKYADIRFDIENEDVILKDILDTIPYEYAGKRMQVHIPTTEFTSVCPWSGLPDFAEIHIKYVPRQKLIEMKSLKYYLTSFRNVGIYQEHATQRILEDLVHVCDPLSMRVEGVWNQRGGLATNTTAEYVAE
jgi:7-cyano-7-deazaguanine reductase